MSSKRKRKFVADELAELLTPGGGAEYDPDALDGLGQGAAVESSDDELLQQQQAATARRRIHGAIDLGALGERYQGRKTSRAAMFDQGGKDAWEDVDVDVDDDEDEDQPLSELSDEGNVWGMDDDEEEGGDKGDGDDGDGLHAGGRLRGSEHTNGLHHSDDDDDKEAYQHDRGDNHAALYPRRVADDHSDQHAREQLEDAQPQTDLQAAFASMEAADQAAVAQIADRAVKEQQKGLAVAAQQALWSRTLDLRVTLQKALSASNTLPLPQDLTTLVSASDHARTAMTALTDSLYTTLTDLLQLHDVVVRQHGAVQEAAQAAGVSDLPAALSSVGNHDDDDDDDGHVAPSSSHHEQDAPHARMSVEACWEALQQRDAHVAFFRDAAVDRWHRKVLLASGNAGLRGGLKALNQSISQQVSTAMQAPERMIQRTRLPQSAVKRIVHHQPSSAKEPHGDDDDEEDQEDDDPVDPETYDDAEFYGTLLREFLDNSNVDGQTLSILQSRTKKRKQVDRKASKGRKLRYHVHDKLVNFTAPVPLAENGFAVQLYANLFGQR